jgi:hypothetical protein
MEWRSGATGCGLATSPGIADKRKRRTVSLWKALILAVLISYMQTPMPGEEKKKFFSKEG